MTNVSNWSSDQLTYKANLFDDQKLFVNDEYGAIFTIHPPLATHSSFGDLPLHRDPQAHGLALRSTRDLSDTDVHFLVLIGVGSGVFQMYLSSVFSSTF